MLCEGAFSDFLMLEMTKRCLRSRISQLHDFLFDYCAPQKSAQTGIVEDDSDLNGADADGEHNVNSGQGKKRPSANDLINACSPVLPTSNVRRPLAELHRNI